MVALKTPRMREKFTGDSRLGGVYDQGATMARIAGLILMLALSSCTITKSASPTPTHAGSARTSPTRFSLGAVDVRAQPPSFNGKCPTAITFTARIRAQGSGTITYRWERSDGTHSATHKINYVTAGVATVKDAWTVRSTLRGWQLVRVLTPVEAGSSRSAFSVRCFG